MSTAVEEDLDLELELENQERRHFRSTHRSCAERLVSGAIIEANCGALFRITGVELHRVERCRPCRDNEMWRPCPVCRELLV